MILRPYQKIAVDDASIALDKHKNTIVVAPTGAGKTIMLSALIGKRYKKGKKILVLQHRDELVSQNKTKFTRVNPKITTSVVDGTEKDWSGDAIFSMVQTLSRPNNLDNMCNFDMIVVDESHHAIAETYTRIINRIKEANNSVEIVGFTATPNRGDKKGLRNIFNNCSHQIEITTLIREGFLVPPKTFVVDVGVRQELENVRKTISDFDMGEVERIMNKRAINERIVEEWKEKAGNRKTVIFCSTVVHAQDVCDEYRRANVRAELLTGETPSDERKQILHDLEHGDIQVVVNVAVLTEGFDAPPVSCIVLTRPCSYKSTMVQMIGRGLRTIDPEEHPGIIKKDCIVLDFGTSVLTHGSLDETVDLEGSEGRGTGAAPEKVCPQCESTVPLSSRECPLCGYEFGQQEKEVLEDFIMTEVDLMDRSPYRWVDLFDNGRCMSASGFNGFGMVAHLDDISIALVKRSNGKLRVVSVGTKEQAIASADDFLREIEDSDGAKKGKRWLNEGVTIKQKEALSRSGITIRAMDFSWNKYKAACWLNYLWNKKDIDNRVMSIGEKNAA
jgi:DNA repair protein RadD|tara:strand:+ start:2326 stop:4002 length:1677 start_codon:yes stop_codon:yes gene_type:complete